MRIVGALLATEVCTFLVPAVLAPEALQRCLGSHSTGGGKFKSARRRTGRNAPSSVARLSGPSDRQAGQNHDRDDPEPVFVEAHFVTIESPAKGSKLGSSAKIIGLIGVPNGIRTRVTAVKVCQSEVSY
jgi:hypothetical protein